MRRLPRQEEEERELGVVDVQGGECVFAVEVGGVGRIV